VTNTLTVNGTISASAPYPQQHSGGSAGGSINITAAEVAGSGTIRANGSPMNNRGGGGGGRISLARVGVISFTGTLQANGGNGSESWARGYAGTIAFPPDYDLVIGGAGHMQSLRLGSDDNNAYKFNSLVVNDGGLLEVDGHPFRNSGYGGAAAIEAGSVHVCTGGVLSASGLGFPHALGAPGNRSIGTIDGGAYGGAGGNNGRTYGSVINPVNLGSSSSSAGGGALVLEVSGTMRVDGTVAADAPTSSLGTGSGGTVSIQAATLSGTGVIRANVNAALRHGGGGGRISLRSNTDTFTGIVTAYGGTISGNWEYGAAGTIYRAAGGIAKVLVANDKVQHNKPAKTVIPAADNIEDYAELSHTTLIVDNLGRVSLSTNAVVGDLYLTGQITNLFLNGWTLTVKSYYHANWGKTNQVVYGGGEIIWHGQRGSVIMLR
jgi:hypothetical protein